MSVSGPTKWWQLRVVCDRSEEAAAHTFFETLHAHAISCVDAEDTPIFGLTPDTHPLWDRMHIIGLLDHEPNAIECQQAQDLQDEGHIQGWSIEPLPDQDWQAPCETAHQAMCFGDTLWVCPSWSPPPASAQIHVTLDPGLAFGTGRHPTTQLCLHWLTKHKPFGQTVIDFGCGSGILGIAAIQLGASHVHAIDHDPQALTATQQNAQNNQCNDAISLHHSSEELPDQVADVLVANILLNPIIELKNTLHRLLKHDGTLVVSGILQDQTASLLEAMQPLLCCIAQDAQDEWALCVLKRA